MAAGLSDHVWSLEEIVTMADSYMLKPGNAGLTRKHPQRRLSVRISPNADRARSSHRNMRVSAIAAIAVTCIVGATRTRHRWLRILLATLAVPIVLFALFGMFIISLILRYATCSFPLKIQTETLPAQDMDAEGWAIGYNLRSMNREHYRHIATNWDATWSRWCLGTPGGRSSFFRHPWDVFLSMKTRG